MACMTTEIPESAGAEVAEAPPEAREEHRELAEEVEDARWRYYVQDAPTLSDAEFDAKMRRLEELEEQLSRPPHARTRRPRRSAARCRPTSPRWSTSSG